MSQHSTVQFWFDPICPFTWITSRWLVEVSQARDFPVTWNPFSLKVLNEGLDEGNDAEAHTQGHRMGRVVQAVRQQHGSDSLLSFYTTIGERIHPGGRVDYDAVLVESLAASGLDAALISATDDPVYDAELEESTHEALRRVGQGVGIPIIEVDSHAFFGPVMSPRPTGADALALWDAYLTVVATPGFFELKRQFTGDIKF